MKEYKSTIGIFSYIFYEYLDCCESLKALWSPKTDRYWYNQPITDHISNISTQLYLTRAKG